MAEPDIFDSDEFKNAKNNAGGQWAPLGYYPEVLITGIKQIKQSKKSNAPATVIEFDILESDVPEVKATKEKPAKGYSYLMGSQHASYGSNVRRSVSELANVPFEAVTPLRARAAVSQAQPYEGTRASLRVTPVTTGKGGIYSKHTFSLLEISPKMKAMIEAAQAAAAAAQQQTA